MKRLALVLLLALVACAPKATVADPWAHGPVAWTGHAVGMSNAPTITPGDIIYFVPTPYAELCGKRQWTQGDMVAVLTADMVYVHRLIWKSPDGWISQGDNNLVEDSVLVTADNYRGRVERFVKQALS